MYRALALALAFPSFVRIHTTGFDGFSPKSIKFGPGHAFGSLSRASKQAPPPRRRIRIAFQCKCKCKCKSSCSSFFVATWGGRQPDGRFFRPGESNQGCYVILRMQKGSLAKLGGKKKQTKKKGRVVSSSTFRVLHQLSTLFFFWRWSGCSIEG